MLCNNDIYVLMDYCNDLNMASKLCKVLTREYELTEDDKRYFAELLKNTQYVLLYKKLTYKGLVKALGDMTMFIDDIITLEGGKYTALHGVYTFEELFNKLNNLYRSSVDYYLRFGRVKDQAPGYYKQLVEELNDVYK